MNTEPDPRGPLKSCRLFLSLETRLDDDHCSYFPLVVVVVVCLFGALVIEQIMPIKAAALHTGSGATQYSGTVGEFAVSRISMNPAGPNSAKQQLQQNPVALSSREGSDKFS